MLRLLLTKMRLLAAVVTVALMLRPGTAGAPGEPQTHRPAEGEYQHLWLTFEGGGEPVQAFVGLRGGKSTTAWFVGGSVPGGVKKQGAYRVLIDSYDLALVDGGLKGTLSIRQVSIWAPMQLLGEVALSIDARRTPQGLVGTWTSRLGGSTSRGNLTGVVTDEKAIRATQGYSPGLDWPGYHGPHGTNRAADAMVALIDDLAQAKPVWRAEERMLSGWGTGVDSRYTRRAAFGTLCGGSGTPVVADGRVYLFHYVPSGDPDPKVLEKVLAEFEQTAKRKPLPVEREALVDYARPFSDTIVTCLDAQTGAILWRVTFPRLSGNYQTHKWRGFNPTACVVGPVLIANDLANNWVALDARKGTVLWTIRRSQKVEGDRGALGAARAGNLAILPTNGKEPVRAVEPATGKVVWEQPGGPQALVWGNPGRERVILLGRDAPACHDAATGKLLWKLEEKLVGHSGSSALIEGDILVGHVLPNSKQRGGFFQGWKLTDAGATKLWQDDYLPFDENLSVTLGKDRAYLAGQNELRCLDLATGKLFGKRVFDGKTERIGSNQWLAVVGDRLLLSPEGQHGSQSLQLLTADPGLKPLGPAWSPPNNSTTAYGVHSLGFPVVDGRVFVRGMDGIYCYDLRRPPMALKGHTRPTSAVAIDAAGRRIVSGSGDDTVKLWNAATGKELLSLPAGSRGVTSLALSADGKRLVAGTWAGAVKVWNLEGEQRVLTLTGHKENITSVAISADGKQVVSGSGDDTLKLWDTVTGKALLTIEVGNDYDVTAVAISPDGKRLATGDGENFVTVWDASTGEELLSLSGHDFAVTCVAFSPDGRRIVSGSQDDTLRLWDAEIGKELAILWGHEDDVTSVSFSADGRRIVSSSEDGTVRVWDVATGKEVLRRGCERSAASAAMSPDGRKLVAASGDDLYVWELSEPRPPGRGER